KFCSSRFASGSTGNFQLQDGFRDLEGVAPQITRYAGSNRQRLNACEKHGSWRNFWRRGEFRRPCYEHGSRDTSCMKIASRLWRNLSTIPSIDKNEKKSRPAALDHLSHGQHNADGYVLPLKANRGPIRNSVLNVGASY